MLCTGAYIVPHLYFFSIYHGFLFFFSGWRLFCPASRRLRWAYYHKYAASKPLSPGHRHGSFMAGVWAAASWSTSPRAFPGKCASLSVLCAPSPLCCSVHIYRCAGLTTEMLPLIFVVLTMAVTHGGGSFTVWFVGFFCGSPYWDRVCPLVVIIYQICLLQSVLTFMHSVSL